jgi:FtsP/CotA-like multicopper oxidase with cupredoxin domain
LDPTQFDRRHLLAGGGAVFFCTLAGHKLSLNQPANLPKLASSVPVPAAVEKANGTSKSAGVAEPAIDKARAREYWIRAEPVRWDIVPTNRDQMMNRRVKGRKKFTAYAYRRYTKDFGSPMGPATIPGPLIDAKVGEQVVIHFRNHVDVPVTMHPHGIFYSAEMDGAYKGRFTDPGGFVQKNRTFTYVWEARADSVGTWLYHDHGPMDPVPVFKGLFGPLIIRPASDPNPPDKDFFLFMHTFSPVATHLNNQFACINGRAYAGNTPTLRSKVGDRVAFHVIALDDDFHTFHIHGHRWADTSGFGTQGNPGSGKTLDTKTFGPGESFTFEFVEDNPGRWFYHCHVFSHLHMGMNGWYLVS